MLVPRINNFIIPKSAYTVPNKPNYVSCEILLRKFINDHHSAACTGIATVSCVGNHNLIIVILL